MVKVHGSVVGVNPHLVNYENRPVPHGGIKNRMANGIKFPLCKNESDTEVTEGCYPTFNDMVRKDESDTDPDMPPLKGPMGISPGGRDIDSYFSGIPNPSDIRELAETHDALV